MNYLTTLNALKARLDELNPATPAPKALDVVVMPPNEDDFLRVSPSTPARVFLVYMGSTFGKSVDIGAVSQEEYASFLAIITCANMVRLFEVLELVKLKLLAFEANGHKPLTLDEVNSPERGDGAWMIKVMFKAYGAICASDLEAHLANAPLLTDPSHTTQITQTV